MLNYKGLNHFIETVITLFPAGSRLLDVAGGSGLLGNILDQIGIDTLLIDPLASIEKFAVRKSFADFEFDYHKLPELTEQSAGGDYYAWYRRNIQLTDLISLCYFKKFGNKEWTHDFKKKSLLIDGGEDEERSCNCLQCITHLVADGKRIALILQRNFSFNVDTFKGLKTQHNELAAIERKQARELTLKDEQGSLDTADKLKGLEKYSTDNIVYELINDAPRLLDEGEKLHHCIFGYRFGVREGFYAIYSVKINSWKTEGTQVTLTESFYSLQISNGFEIMQCRGLCNKMIDPITLDIIRAHVKSLSMTNIKIIKQILKKNKTS